MQTQNKTPFDNFETFEEFFEQAEKRPDYWAERAKLEFTKEVIQKMTEAGISKTELASRMEVWPGMVTRLLSGRNNFELVTMVRIAMALDCRFRSHLEPIGTKTLWLDILTGPELNQQTAEAWNPKDFRAFELFFPKNQHLNYAPVPVAA